MKAEIAEPGRMTQSGSSLLKLIQNNTMPILDLFVRESIQNSLDAKSDTDPYVTVVFNTGKFLARELNSELEGITEALNSRFPLDEYNFIAVRDTNTVGLTGKLHYDEVTDNNYGNLLKLIYEISKPQEEEGAGGSWGLGKTVYFRVGIGLVIYYSRIKNEYGKYESRLAASLVENEMQKDSLIPAFKGKLKRGIAWWGKKIGENKTQPVTDDEYINKILKLFSIKPYNGEATGTTVIIPYINDKRLLENNQIEYIDGEDNIIRPYWQNSVEEYLKIAVQRWYAPRLNNKFYPYGKYLRVKVNESGISNNLIEPVFKIEQALYNRAITKADNLDDILNNSEAITKYENISVRNVLENTVAGTIAYTKVKLDLLKMTYPDNKPSPYMYFNCEIGDKIKNKPLMSFTRKPGMIVSYESIGAWVDGIGMTDKDEFILAIFVLNSDNKLTALKGKSSLEEYIRKSEMADHTSWSDYSIGTINPRIVSRIQALVNKKIAKEFSVDDEENVSKLNSGLGKLFGELLLPPENFGKKPSAGVNGKKVNSKHVEKHKNVVFTLNNESIKYLGQSLEIEMQLKSRCKIKRSSILLAIDSETGTISFYDWENKMGLDVPFYIKNISILFEKYDDISENSENIILDENTLSVKYNDIECKLLNSTKGRGYAINFESLEKHMYTVNIYVTLYMIKRDIKPAFLVKMDEGDN